ncbi:MAG: hypothetical protein AAF585_03860 [Verrucomicrobiota bacterium]
MHAKLLAYRCQIVDSSTNQHDLLIHCAMIIDPIRATREDSQTFLLQRPVAEICNTPD